jgi:hypothetical protein
MPALPNFVYMLIWLAVLGAIVYFGTRFAGKAASKVGA